LSTSSGEPKSSASVTPPQPPPSSTALSSARRGSIPEREDHVSGLEKDDVVVGRGARLPAERFVEAPGATQVGDSQRD
jgi:hypothetical protein